MNVWLCLASSLEDDRQSSFGRPRTNQFSVELAHCAHSRLTRAPPAFVTDYTRHNVTMGVYSTSARALSDNKPATFTHLDANNHHMSLSPIHYWILHHSKHIQLVTCPWKLHPTCVVCIVEQVSTAVPIANCQWPLPFRQPSYLSTISYRSNSFSRTLLILSLFFISMSIRDNIKFRELTWRLIFYRFLQAECN